MHSKYNPSVSDSYGAPQAPSYNPTTNFATAGYGYNAVPYVGFYSDFEMVMKLGIVALIVFIVLAVIVILFLLMMCCIYCPMLIGSRSSGYQQEQQTGNGYMDQNMQGNRQHPLPFDNWLERAF